MYKKLLMISIAFVLPLSLISCGSANTDTITQENTSEQIDSERDTIYNNIMKNLGYTITDLRVIAEDEGYHIVLNVPGTPDMLQKLCEDSLSFINKYAEENNIAIYKINPIILTSGNTAFGWSTDGGTLYSSDIYPIAENVSVSDITTKLSEIINMSAYYAPDAEDVSPIADEDIEWEIISTQDYVRNNKPCLGYRVYINTDRASTTQYDSIFKEITNDNKYLHTVWFYFSKSAADGSEIADVTMEQVAEGIIPLPRNKTTTSSKQ